MTGRNYGGDHPCRRHDDEHGRSFATDAATPNELPGQLRIFLRQAAEGAPRHGECRIVSVDLRPERQHRAEPADDGG